jgi:CubicO group peptidase (beta-lactamase class C family)
MNAGSLARMLAGLAERHNIPGAQLALYRDGQTLLAETGHERHGDAALVSQQSGFPFGSVTKSFTATVVLQLVSSGDLELDEPIGSYIPELAAAPNGIDRLVTPRQLLSHTSGLPCDFDAETPETTSFRRYALSARTLELVHRPGTAFSYSNAGFILIGLLIEDVTGMTWWDAVESLVLRPLNIEPAFYPDPRISLGHRPIVSGHSVSARFGRTVAVQSLLPMVYGPAGGLAGSAADLVAFGRMHLGAVATAGLLAAPELELMRSGAGDVAPFGLASGWGLGLARFHTGDADWFGHDGTADGTTCHLRFEPVRGVALAVTTNAMGGLRLWEDVLIALRDHGLEVGNYPAPRIEASPVTEVPDCAGDYLNGDVRFSVVRNENGVLHLDLDDGLPRDLTFYEDLRFCADAPATDEPPVAGRFVRDGDTGEIWLMEIGGRVARRKAGVSS